MPRKNYNGVNYDTDLDYTAEIEKAAQSGNNARAAVLERERNAKIAGEGLGYEATSNYAQYLPASTGVPYDLTTDYMALMNEAQQRGDYTAAFNYEKQRNAKITGEGLDMPTTSMFERYNPETRYTYDPSQNPEYTRLQEQQNAIFDKIMNMGDFKYNAESDPLYQQYRQQYMTQGRQAMRDTMGQAAALTGGYGNTYAQQAGEQAYAAYLSRLNDVLPELYGDAYNRYRNERSDLLGEYSLLNQRSGTEYERGYNNWANRLNMERQDEENAYNRRRSEEDTAYNRRQTETANARQHLLSVISASGYIPTDAELQEAGMTRAEAEALRQAYLTQLQQSFNGGSGGGRSRGGGSGRRSGGSRGSSGGGGGTVQPSDTQFNEEEAIAQLWNQYESTSPYSSTPMASNQFSGLQRQISAYLQKGDVGKAADLIAQNQKNMTEEQYNSLYRLLLQAGG